MDYLLSERSHLCETSKKVSDGNETYPTPAVLIQQMNTLLVSLRAYVQSMIVAVSYNGVNLIDVTIRLIDEIEGLAFVCANRTFEEKVVQCHLPRNINRTIAAQNNILTVDILQQLDCTRQAKGFLRVVVLNLSRFLALQGELLDCMEDGPVLPVNQDWVLSDFVCLVSDCIFSWLLELELFRYQGSSTF